MLSILIGHSYFASSDRKQLDRAKPYPPLATLQVAAMLRRSGHGLALFDSMLADSTLESDSGDSGVEGDVEPREPDPDDIGD